MPCGQQAAPVGELFRLDPGAPSGISSDAPAPASSTTTVATSRVVATIPHQRSTPAGEMPKATMSISASTSRTPWASAPQLQHADTPACGRSPPWPDTTLPAPCPPLHLPGRASARPAMPGHDDAPRGPTCRSVPSSETEQAFNTPGVMKHQRRSSSRSSRPRFASCTAVDGPLSHEGACIPHFVPNILPARRMAALN